MYDLKLFNEMARDAEFVWEVRRVALALIAADSSMSHRFVPLLQFGPDSPAVLIRLSPAVVRPVPPKLSDEAAQALLRVQQRVLSADT